LIKSSKFFGARLRQAFGAAGPAEKLSKKRRANARRFSCDLGNNEQAMQYNSVRVEVRKGQRIAAMA
jgi:hypothetical protein